MAKLQHCILLSIGFLTPAIRTAAVPSDVVALPWEFLLPDTSASFGPHGQGIRHLPWFRRTQGSPWQRLGVRQDVARTPLAGMNDLAEPTYDQMPLADLSLWGANGNVVDIARLGNTLYMAGSFRSVGENSGGLVSISANTSEALRPFPKVAGSVYAIVSDGSGGWYIGGEFTAVGGKPRFCVAQIRADGSVSDWDPSVTGSPGYISPPVVTALAIHRKRLFIGGQFRNIGGQPHENLGCVDVGTGEPLSMNLDTHIDGGVRVLAVDDTVLFVGGRFSSIAGHSRNSLAAVNAATGEVMPWQAHVNGWVLSLLVRDDTLYIGGNFVGVNSQKRPLIAALDIRTAQLLPFDARAEGLQLDFLPGPEVAALSLVGDTLFVAGSFTRIGGASRPSLAALNAGTGDALPWVPSELGPQYDGFPPPLCEVVTVAGETVYIGGWFQTVGGESRPFVAALDRRTGVATGWNPKPDLTAYAVVARNDTVFMGGIFSLVGEWKHRAGLAAIDLNTGTVKPWNPNPDGGICNAVAVRGDRVFVSGDFSTIGGDPQPRRYFAALDTVNGEVVDWDPGANSIANAFLLEGDTLYVGGEFTQVGGQTRNYLAALSTTTGEVLPWDPDASWPVYALARAGNTVYVGGIFQRMGGQWRSGIAAVDATTGALTPWNPDTDNRTVKAVLVGENTVYVGGAFGEIGGQPRRSLAALDATTGKATPWDPQPTAWGIPTEVKALALMGETLIVGGAFGSIGDQPRICLAAVDTSTGLATGWDPGLDGLVWSLATDGNTVYVGGGFTRAGGIPSVGLAAFSIPDHRPPAPRTFALAQSIPNPARSSAVIRFSLPQAATVTLSVYDLQGRRVAALLDHAFHQAGAHDVPVPSGRWKPGVYLYRLEANSRSATRKMVVIP